MIDPLLPPYEGIALADIHLIESPEAAAAASAALLAADAIGFDTESKPTFTKGEVSTGPHLIQLATDNQVYLFPVRYLPGLDGLKAVLESETILKVGFGLESDIARLRSKLGIELRNVFDLAKALRRDGQKNMIGAKGAVAHYFGQRLQKSKKASTSNWANPQLTERQMIYAADDAQVALRVFRVAGLPVSVADTRETDSP
jgi:RNA polymerase sigma factor for flagellar operon FliA